MIVRTTYAKLADPSRRGALAVRIAKALEGSGHRWVYVGTPADAASEVWDLAVHAGCPNDAVVAEVHRRLLAALEDNAVVLKAWSFASAG